MKSNSHAARRKFHILYKTTCVPTGKWYIGIHSTDYLYDDYLGSGRYLTNSVKKYGKENHTREILEVFENRKLMIAREAEVVDGKLLLDPMCMNLMKGGTGREVHSNILKEQARAKISEAAKAMWARRKADPEKLAAHIAKIQKPEYVVKRAEALKAKGYKRSEEQLKNLRDGQTKYYSSADTTFLSERGAKSAVTRQIRGNANGGRPVGISMTDEQKAHLSARLKGIAKPAGLGDKVREGLKRYHSKLGKVEKRS